MLWMPFLSWEDMSYYCRCFLTFQRQRLASSYLLLVREHVKHFETVIGYDIYFIICMWPQTWIFELSSTFEELLLHSDLFHHLLTARWDPTSCKMLKINGGFFEQVCWWHDDRFACSRNTLKTSNEKCSRTCSCVRICFKLLSLCAAR